MFFKVQLLFFIIYHKDFKKSIPHPFSKKDKGWSVLPVFAKIFVRFAPVAELEYAQRLGRCPARVRGSSPLGSTNDDFLTLIHNSASKYNKILGSNLLSNYSKKVSTPERTGTIPKKFES